MSRTLVPSFAEAIQAIRHAPLQGPHKQGAWNVYLNSFCLFNQIKFNLGWPQNHFMSKQLPCSKKKKTDSSIEEPYPRQIPLFLKANNFIAYGMLHSEIKDDSDLF